MYRRSARTGEVSGWDGGTQQRMRYQAIRFRSWKKPPLGPSAGSVASQTIVSAPSSTLRVAFGPPMSVRTQPGSTQFTRADGNAEASITVIAFSVAFEIE